MDYKIEITDTAYKELDDILEYIAVKLKNIAAAKKLFNDFNSGLENIAMFPLSMAKIKNDKNNGDYRKFFVGNYIVIYKIDCELIKILTIRYAPMGLGDNI